MIKFGPRVYQPKRPRILYANSQGVTHHPLVDQHFVGLDGEGMTLPNGEHRYVLLTVGQHSYHRDGEPLSWREVFRFLFDRFLEDRDATYVGYYLGYDFTQWFRTLAENRAHMLLTSEGIAARKRTHSGGNKNPFPVYLDDDWECDILASKRFKLHHASIPRKRGTMYVCDVGPFFQMPFLKAIDPKDWPDPVVTDDEYAILSEGKQRRASAILDDDMIRYNALENDVLARVMTRIRDGFGELNIHLNRNEWYGPGQVASKWLSSVGCPTVKDVHSVVPSYARDTAIACYYGGWFEITRHGVIDGTVHQYDINSAYPYQIAQLPCLRHGKWSRGKGSPSSHGLSMVRITTGSQSFSEHGWVDPSQWQMLGGLPHRTRVGWILRPVRTSGWYWQHEVEAARRAGLVHDIEYHEWMHYDPCSCDPPLAEIRTLYGYRLSVGKKTPTGKGAKIAYNSAYGKMAQSIGDPKFGNSVYASLITAGCRCMILDAIASHPVGAADVLMVATDGIVFRTAHPSLPLSNELGQWDHEEHSRLTLALPGVYWNDAARDRIHAGKSPELKSRGISARDLAMVIDSLDDQFSSWDGQPPWPSTRIPVSFAMVTALQALRRGKWELAGTVKGGHWVDGKWIGETRLIDTDPTHKRLVPPLDGLGMKDEHGSWRTFAYDVSERLQTTKYDRRFGDELRLMREDEPMTPDGDVQSVLTAALLDG